MIHRLAILLPVLTLMLTTVQAQQPESDPHSLELMGVPLQGPDSIFLPALQSVGFERTVSTDDEPFTYYLRGDYYGLKSRLIVSTDEQTGMLSSVLVSVGPYTSYDLYEKNNKYLLLKLQRTYGNLVPKGDGTLHKWTDRGYVKLSNTIAADKSRTIQMFFLPTGGYYKDALNMGLKGLVQEVVTENPINENRWEHFDPTGKNTTDDITDREYNENGYLIRASMPEKNGLKSELKYMYDDNWRLTRRILSNPAENIRSYTEYTYNEDNEISTTTQRVFNSRNECILSIHMRNSYTDYDDSGNWTRNEIQLIYWEKGRQEQNMHVVQTRTISYWD